jgi:hypothetical protein
MANAENIFYVYAHYKADTGEIFYIGKGRDNRAYQKKKTDGRSEWWHRIVNKHGYTIKLLHENLSSEDALAKERELIQYYGRQDISTGPLINLTDGGEGGLNVGELTRKKRSISVKKTTDDINYRKELSQRVKSQWDNNPERKQRVSEIVKAKLASDDARRKLSERVKKQWEKDLARKERMREWAKNRVITPEYREKLRIGAQKRLQNPEWRRKQKEAMKKRSQNSEWRERRKKEFTLVAPDGTIHHVRGMMEFCKKNNLHSHCVNAVLLGKQTHHHGWKKHTSAE